MNIVDHGAWVAYKPVPFPIGPPRNALFVKREGDGVDWYEYVRDPSSFQPDSVKLMVHYEKAVDGLLVGPAVRDVTFLFPAGQMVLEITDYSGDDPQAEFGRKIYDPKKRTFAPLREWAQPTQPSVDDLLKSIKALQARVKKLEGKR